MIHFIDFLVPLSKIEGRPELVEVAAVMLADAFGTFGLVVIVTFFAEDDTVAEPDAVMFRSFVIGDNRRPDIERAALALRRLFGLRSIKVGIDDNIHEM